MVPYTNTSMVTPIDNIVLSIIIIITSCKHINTFSSFMLFYGLPVLTITIKTVNRAAKNKRRRGFQQIA